MVLFLRALRLSSFPTCGAQQGGGRQTASPTWFPNEQPKSRTPAPQHFLGGPGTVKSGLVSMVAMVITTASVLVSLLFNSPGSQSSAQQRCRRRPTSSSFESSAETCGINGLFACMPFSALLWGSGFRADSDHTSMQGRPRHDTGKF